MNSQPSKKFFTILVVPDRTSRVRKLTVPRVWVYVATGAVPILFVILATLFLHYVHVTTQLNDYQSVYQENREVALQLRTYQDRVRKLDSRLDHLERVEHKLRVMTSLEDPARNIAIGPLTDREDPAAANILEEPSMGADGTSDGPQTDRRDFEFTGNPALDSRGLVIGERIEFEIEVEAVRQPAARVA